MKNRYQISLVMITVSVLISSCSSAGPKENGIEQPIERTPDITRSPATQPTAISEIPFRIDASCWPVKLLPEGNEITGSMVFAYFPQKEVVISEEDNEYLLPPGKYQINTTETNEIFAWDISSFHGMPINTGFMVEISEEGYVSPDGKYIAMISGKNLILISPDGQQTFPLSHENIVIQAFLPDGRISLVDGIKSSFQKEEVTDVYYILNPISGEMTKHSVLLPNIEEDFGRIQYSPDMKFVLYKSVPKGDGMEFTLYDLERNEVVWVGPPRDANLKYPAHGIPVWRPGSSMLTTLYWNENGHNYYSISLAGKVSPLTSFTDAYLLTTATNLWGWGFDAQSPNWSPSGRYLVSAGLNINSTSMYIWDDTEKVVYKPCLPNEEHRHSTVFQWMHWSYDGSYIWVGVRFSPTSTATDVFSPSEIDITYILDLDHKIIYQLPDESNNPEYYVLNGERYNKILGWVNWEIP